MSRARGGRRNKYARWRVFSLALVHLLMIVHILHWKLAGRTLAPLEFNEVMHALELGIVTAGFLFMAAAILATAIFGRFFCSWGCHILALQDLCAWLLGKLRIRPRPIRSRLLLWVPMIAAGYMFLWPQVSRIAIGAERASMRVATDADGWASFVTENFWRNLPGPGIALTTFFICGFLIVYVLGTRSFCSYGCPYGAVFGLADRFAPGRIRVGPDCTQCAKCTAVCTSHVRVHEEVARYGMVVNPACMKDLDCVSVCPQDTLRFGFGRPSLLRRIVGIKEVQQRFDFSWPEECAAVCVFVVVLVTYRGLYDLLPFLLSLAIAAILSYAAIVGIRLLTRPDVRFHSWSLRKSGRLTGGGAALLAILTLVTGLTAHSAIIRYSAFCGERHYHSAFGGGPLDENTADAAITHLSRAQSWGMLESERIERMLGDLFTARQRWTEAEDSRRRSLDGAPYDAVLLSKLGLILSHQGRHKDAESAYLSAIRSDPTSAEPYYGLGVAKYRRGELRDAVEHLEEALRRKKDYADAHYQLGTIFVETQAIEKGIQHLSECVRLRPGFGDARYNLAVALASAGRLSEAATEIDRAIAIQPDDVQTQRFRAFLESMIPIEQWPANEARIRPALQEEE